MWLEITSPCEHAAVAKLLEQYGLDPTFSLLHTAIDNFEAGHGRVAMSVCHAYLDRIRRTQGEQAVQEAWRRVWRGYTAYGVIGDMFTPLRTHLLKNPARPIQDFTDLIANKARFGAGQHGFIKIQGKPIDEYFAKPREFMDALVRANYVEPGDPWRSTFINRLIRFDGPMYQVSLSNVFCKAFLHSDKNAAESQVAIDMNSTNPASHLLPRYLTRTRSTSSTGGSCRSGPNPSFRCII